jgi:hypothetical protein
MERYRNLTTNDQFLRRPYDVIDTPVADIFFSAHNIEKLWVNISRISGIPMHVIRSHEHKHQRLHKDMLRAFRGSPGGYNRQFFASDTAFRKAILEHVQRLNAYVVKEGVRNVEATESLQLYHANHVVPSRQPPIENPVIWMAAKNPQTLRYRHIH